MHYRNRLLEELHTSTLSEALSTADQLITEAQADLDFLKRKRTQIESLINLEEDGEHPTENEKQIKRTPIPDRVVEILEREGDLTWDELYSHIPDVRPGTVYANVRNRLVSIGRVEIVKASGKLDSVRLVPDWQPDAAPVFERDYIGKLLSLDPTLSSDDELVLAFAASLKTYEEQVVWPRNGGKRLWANHTYKAIGNHGLMDAIRLMVGGSETAGFAGLTEVAPSATVENIVDRFPERFDEDTVKAARKRLGKEDAK
jgi:hypothetical protein